MQDAAPRDAIPDEFRVPERETLSAKGGGDYWSSAVINAFVVGGAAYYVPVQLIPDLLHNHPLRAAYWSVILCAGAHALYDFGWRQPYRIELTATTLRWRAPFRRLEIPVASIRRVHLAVGSKYANKLVVDRPGRRNRKLSLRRLAKVRPVLAALLAESPGTELRVSPLSARQGL